jgi:hypothetical protein
MWPERQMNMAAAHEKGPPIGQVHEHPVVGAHYGHDGGEQDGTYPGTGRKTPVVQLAL